ncbi:MAG: MBL fold metallo-hydrolase [Verrucomicrobiales bacterium]|nr:MBL fold metallo-hydrolase [Verrucomicrobiales bacterium]
MTLEDHAGDVARKARLMSGVPLEQVALAGGVAVALWEAFERDGRPPMGLEWSAAASVLELHAASWRALAEGWLPREVDPGRWQEWRVISTEGNGMSVNAFLVWDPVSRVAALFDTGFDAAPVFELSERHRLEVQHLFLTHTHRDHVAALEPLRARFPRLQLHTDYHGAPASQRNRADSPVEVGCLRIAYRPTPGHADDGATYLVTGFAGDAPALAVVGDAVFAGSMGGAPGKGTLAKARIREAILSLPPATLICPGHGPVTTVGEEQRHNPFFACDEPVDPPIPA